MVSVERIKTNHMLLDDLGLWDEFRINKTRDSSVVQRYYNLLKELIDNQLSSTKSWLNTTEARNYFFNGAKYQREVFSALEEDLDELLEKNYFFISTKQRVWYHQPTFNHVFFSFPQHIKIESL